MAKNMKTIRAKYPKQPHLSASLQCHNGKVIVDLKVLTQTGPWTYNTQNAAFTFEKRQFLKVARMLEKGQSHRIINQNNNMRSFVKGLTGKS